MHLEEMMIVRILPEVLVFIGPEFDHWQCLSLTPSLTDSCLVDLMAANDTKCMMMSQQLLKAVKRFLKLKKVV